jgi:hypothetical protein
MPSQTPQYLTDTNTRQYNKRQDTSKKTQNISLLSAKLWIQRHTASGTNTSTFWQQMKEKPMKILCNYLSKEEFYCYGVETPVMVPVLCD